MRGEGELLRERANFVVVVALVEAEPLRDALRRLRAIDGNALERLSCHLEVDPIGAVDRETKRYAGRVGQ